MLYIASRVWMVLLLVVVPVPAMAESAGTPEGVTLLPIGPAYASTKVNTAVFRHHAIVTHGQRQFVCYYSPDGTVVVAHRPLDQTQWTVVDTGIAGNVRDAHNVISLGISADGTLHLSHDHHGHPLRYRRSRAALDPTAFGEAEPMTGQHEGRVTYPQFVQVEGGPFLFFYRDGGSGNGDLLLNTYDAASGTWSALHHPLISGLGEYNPYWCRPGTGQDGSLHLFWCWRRTGDASTNSRVCYARSRDGGRTWTNSGGVPYALPITPEAAEVAEPVGEGNNLSNQDSSEVDSQGLPHAVYRKNDPQGVPQYWHLWWNGDAWHTTQVSRFTEGFDMKGGGTLRNPLSRPDLLIEPDGGVIVLYRDTRQGGMPMAARAVPPAYEEWVHFPLADMNLLQWEPNYDLVRWKRDGVLDLFVLPSDQGDHETVTQHPAETAAVLEWRPSPPGARSLAATEAVPGPANGSR